MTCGYLLDIIYLLNGGQIMETLEMITLYYKCVMPA